MEHLDIRARPCQREPVYTCITQISIRTVQHTEVRLEECLLAVEGDLRLVEQEEVANWVTGRPQVFFEGSWSQVCAGRFDNRAADVACRQLGFGSGTALLGEVSGEQPAGHEVNVFPEVALSGLNCTGTEERLVDCETDPIDFANDNPIGTGCQSSTSNGLVLGCVRAPENGETPDLTALSFCRGI